MGSPPLLPPVLLVVMPVYNERDSVGRVVREWFAEIARWTPDFVFLAVNDGSTDDTLAVLRGLREECGARLEIIDQTNRGHGQSCLVGYREAASRRVPHVFQIDSDGQCDPRFFGALWRGRDEWEVIYGRRVRRDDGWRRTAASLVVRVFLLTFFRTSCVDANVPYRLMRTTAVAPLLDRIPADFSRATGALAVLLRRQRPRPRHGAVPIRFRNRYGGEPTVRVAKFGAKARELHRQLSALLRAGSSPERSEAAGIPGAAVGAPAPPVPAHPGLG